MFTVLVRDLVVMTMVCAGTMVGGSANAVAAPDEWVPAVSLSQASRGLVPGDVAVARNGAMAATWATRGGSVWVSRRPSGGAWQDAERLVDNGLGSSPQLAYDGRDRLLVAWAEIADTEPSGGPSELKVRRTLPSGAWGAEAVVARREIGRFEGVDLDVNRAGAAVVGCRWVPTTSGSAPRMFNRALAVVRPASGPWEPAVRWTSVVFEEVEVGDSGVSAIAMVEVHPVRPPDFLVARHHAGGWDAPHVVGRSDSGWGLGGVGLAVDGSGTTTAAWMFTSHARWRLRTSTAAAGSPWSAAVTVDRRGTGTSFPLEVMAARTGAVLVVWHTDDDQILAVRRPAGGDWASAVRLRPRESDPMVPSVTVGAAMQANGRAVVAWHNPGTDFDRGRGVVVRLMSRRGEWGATARLAGARLMAGRPATALNRGEAAVAWAGKVRGGFDRYRILVRTHVRASG